MAIAALAAGLLASCAAAPTPTPSSREHFSEAEYGVPASPRVVMHGRAVPKGGGRYLVGEPYRVAGKTYVPRDNPNYSATGYASWYGSSFHGRKTANGEVYDMNDLTAAHPTLPLPSYARVTNLANGRSVVVRVNDRGPFKSKRIIDVSSTVAEVLDFKRAGVARVKVDYVGPARMDGLDRNMLLASYRVPGRAAPNTAIAANTLSGKRPVILASAPPPRSKPTGSAGTADPMALAPTPAALTYDDPLAPLILRTGFASSYLPTDRFSKAQAAAATLAAGGTRAAVQSQPIVVVQLGAFADASNATRLGARFSTYGKVMIADRTAGDRSVHVVRVVVAGKESAAAVIEAARAAGLSGAFIVAR